MEFVSTSKFLIISPRKVRPLVKQILGFTPERALAVLSVLNKSASLPLAKAIKTVLANAKTQGGVSGEKLVFKSIEVGEGPRLKRGRPVSRGRWHPYKKRMSHIRVVLQTVKSV